MAKAKHSSYPIMDLPEAIEKIRKIFEQERTHPVSREVAAQHMDYAGLNGASAMALGALAHYGLLDRAGKSETRVSPLAVDILLPDDAEKYTWALRQAASSPDLFRELDERFPESAPSEANLRHYLLRREFSDRAIGPAIRAYLSTRSFLAHNGACESLGLTPDDDEKSPPNQHVEGDAPMRSTVQNAPTPPPVRQPSSIREGDYWRDVFELEEGEVAISLPRHMSEESFQDLSDWLDLVKRKAARAVRPSKKKSFQE